MGAAPITGFGIAQFVRNFVIYWSEFMPYKTVVFRLGTRNPRLSAHTGKGGSGTSAYRPCPLARAQRLTNAGRGAAALADLLSSYLNSLTLDSRKKKELENDMPRINAILKNREADSGVIFEYVYATDGVTGMTYCMGGGVCGAGDSYDEAVKSMRTGKFSSLIGRKKYHIHTHEYLWIKKVEASKPKEKSDTTSHAGFHRTFGLTEEEKRILEGQMEATHLFFSKSDLERMKKSYEALKKAQDARKLEAVD